MKWWMSILLGGHSIVAEDTRQDCLGGRNCTNLPLRHLLVIAMYWCHLPFHPLYGYPSVPNRGTTLWVQQFWAMFLKRFYNSVRFFGALFSQFILPMLFVLCALVLAVTLPGPNQDDPRRALLLENSALSDNITVFHIQFGDEVSNPFNFSVSQIEQLHLIYQYYSSLVQCVCPMCWDILLTGDLRSLHLLMTQL